LRAHKGEGRRTGHRHHGGGDKNLRPRDATPFSRYQAHGRDQHMTDAADEITEIAKGIAPEKGCRPPGAARARYS
jgi:hypothetical protein